MGMFDEVDTKCPDCGAITVLQSKGAECPYLEKYQFESAPNPVAIDLVGVAFECHACRAVWRVEADVTMRIVPSGPLPTDAYNGVSYSRQRDDGGKCG